MYACNVGILCGISVFVILFAIEGMVNENKGQGHYLEITPRTRILTSTMEIDLSKEDGKDQESIQSSAIPDPGHRMGKRQQPKKTSYT